MRLPENQLALIDALCQSGKKPVVVLFGGSVVELPFAGRVGAILHMFLPGQNGGTAAARLLFGDCSPSGRLPERYEDVPFGRMFGRLSQEIYQESIYVGYRYYITAGKTVRYPFGYGLSYTTFAYSDMEAFVGEGTVVASCEVANTGSRAAAEVVQLYVKAPESCVFKPERELRGFQKVRLEPGERKRVSITVPLEDLRCFHTGENRWLLEGGQYLLQFCADCQTILLSQTLELAGEKAVSVAGGDAYRGADTTQMTNAAFEALCGHPIPAPPPRYPVTTESRFTDLRRGVLGRVVTSTAVGVTELQRRLAERMPEGPERDNRIKGARFLRRILETGSLRSLSMSSGGALPWNLAQGAAELINSRPLRGVWHILRPIQVPPLPKRLKDRGKGGVPQRGAGTAGLVDLCGLRAEVDKAATRDWYAGAAQWDCDCGHCRNFLALAQERALPAPILELLDELGIPPEKATYVCEMYPEAGGHCYNLGFRIAGSIPNGEASTAREWGEVRCLREMCPCSAPDFPEPHFDLEFSVTLPWVLDEPD